MTKTIQNTRRTALALLAVLTLLFLLSMPVLAASGTDTVEIGEDGTVTIVSDRLADEMVSSAQVRIKISAAEGASVGFAFDAGLAGRLTNSSYRDGALNIYVAGTAPLMAAGQNRLTLGAISGGDLESAELPEDALQYVYGARVIAQSAEAQVRRSGSETQPDDEPGETPAPVPSPESGAESRLRKALELARGIERTGYTETSYAEFLAALEEAEAVLAKSGATDAELDAAAAALQRAIDRLVPVADADGSGPVIGDGADDGTGSGAPEPSADPQSGEGQNAAGGPSVTDGPAASPELTASPKPSVSPEPADDTGPSISPEFTGGTGSAATTAPTAVPTTTANAGGQAGAPDTGDGSPILPWALVLCLSCGLLAAALLGRRSRSGR